MARLVKEDIGFTHGNTLQRVRHNLVKGGSRLKMDPGKIILRPPTKSEIQAADLNPSDYQIAQLRILSKILFDFGLVSKVYRAKKATVSRNNGKRIEKFKTIFRTFLQNFNSNEPIANVRRAFALVTDETFTAVDLVNVLKATKNWQSEEQLLGNLATIYRNINAYGQAVEPSANDIKTVRQTYNNLSQYIDTELAAGHNEQEIQKSITYANTINNVMAEDELENAYDIVYKDTNVNTVSDLEADIDQYLSEQQTEGKSMHANTVLHEEALRNLRELSVKMKNDGFSGNLTPGNIFEYLKANEPSTINFITTSYDISPDELTDERFPNWESVAKFFYSPDMIRHIEQDLLGVQQRARSAGENRKGALLAVDAKTVKQRKEALQKQIDKRKNGPSAALSLEDKLKAKEEEYEEAKKIRDGVKADYIEAQRRGEAKSVLKELEKKYNEVKDIAFKIGKTAASIRHALKVAGEAGKENKVEKSDIEKMKDLEKEEKKIIAKARKELGDDADLREFDATYGKAEDDTDDIWDFDAKTEVDYLSWSFVVNTTNPKITDFIVQQLTQGLTTLNKYINVDKFEPEYEDLRGTQIIVDYPSDSKLAKILKKKPDFAYQMMDSIVHTVRSKLKVNISYYDDEEYIKINEEF